MRQKDWFWRSKRLRQGLGGVCLWGVCGLTACELPWVRTPKPPVARSTADPPQPPTAQRPKTLDSLHYQVLPHPQALIHTVKIPRSGYIVRPSLAETVQTVEQMAQTSGAIAVLNGGYFDPNNQKSTSVVTLNSLLIADPQTNERLVANPSLMPYLDKILNRSEFRRYQCGSEIRYAIALHRDRPPSNCQLIDRLGAGPRLLPNVTAEAEGFWDAAPGQEVRDPIGLNQPNARSAIGLTRNGDILWVMVAQALPQKPGLSIPTLAKLMAHLGAVEAMNLDGGSSASLYYAGKAIYGKQDETGQAVKRSVKSVLVVTASP